MIGARPGTMSALKRLVGSSMANSITAYVIPDARIARSLGLDVEQAGFAIVTNPRHASVLLLVGELPGGLASAAAVCYAQMPRPRLLITVGSEHFEPLPPPDISVPLGQQHLEEAVDTARDMVLRNAWSRKASPFEIPSHDAHEQPDDDGQGDEDDPESDDMDHGDMDHDDGFMSMIAMTKDLPRSRDGLPMEWVDAPFGPLFRGLPAGLAPTFTLDGDVVASVEIARLATHRDLSDSLQGPLESLPDRLAHVDPYAPIAYRILAGRAVESMTGNAVSDELASSHIGALERHRAANHLGWLADFAALLGIGWMSDRAAELHLALVRAGDIAHVTMLLAPIDTLIRRGSRVPLLKRRLAEIGTFDMESAADLQGPVAKAAGIETDSRSGEPLYQTLAFEPVLRDANDAWSRYQVRLAEISQSLDIVSALGVCSVEHTPIASNLTGSGSATIETPRGMATLHIEVNDGVVRSADVQTPSQNLVKLVPTVAEHAELADALVGIASLDISPWEVV